MYKLLHPEVSCVLLLKSQKQFAKACFLIKYTKWVKFHGLWIKPKTCVADLKAVTVISVGLFVWVRALTCVLLLLCPPAKARWQIVKSFLILREIANLVWVSLSGPNCSFTVKRNLRTCYVKLSLPSNNSLLEGLRICCFQQRSEQKLNTARTFTIQAYFGRGMRKGLISYALDRM